MSYCPLGFLHQRCSIHVLGPHWGNVLWQDNSLECFPLEQCWGPTTHLWCALLKQPQSLSQEEERVKNQHNSCQAFVSCRLVKGRINSLQQWARLLCPWGSTLRNARVTELYIQWHWLNGLLAIYFIEGGAGWCISIACWSLEEQQWGGWVRMREYLWTAGTFTGTSLKLICYINCR